MYIDCNPCVNHQSFYYIHLDKLVKFFNYLCVHVCVWCLCVFVHCVECLCVVWSVCVLHMCASCVNVCECVCVCVASVFPVFVHVFSNDLCC